MLSRAFNPNVDPQRVQYGYAFGLCFDGPTIADTNEDPLVLIRNAGTNALAAFFYFRRLQSRSTFASTLRFYSGPTITANGSGTKTPLVRKLGSSNASLLSCYTGPTIAANGTLIDAMASSSFAQSDVSYTPLVVPPGQNMLVTLQCSSISAVPLVVLDWFESA